MADNTKKDIIFNNLYKNEGALKFSGESPLKKEVDYRGIFTPSRKQITATDDGIKTQKNIFDLSTYYWYPENFTTMFSVYDLYNTMGDLISSAPKEGQGQISMAISDIKNELKTTGKLIGGALDRVKDTFGKIKNTAFGVNDTNKASPLNVLIENEFLQNVPYIKVTEFQPQQEIGAFLNNMKLFWETLQDLLNNKEGGATRLEKLKGIFSSEGLTQILNDLTGLDPNEPDYIRNVLRIPNFFYENMIGGTYTAQYFVPYFNQPNYLNAMGATGWESRSLKQQFFGNMIAGLVDKIPGLGQFDLAGRPKFNIEGNNPLPETVTARFNLFNYNLPALIANMKFIHSITAGAFWIQSGFLQISSNLFDIEVDGRFRYYFCKANVKIEFGGKVRKLNDAQTKEIKKELPRMQNKSSYARVPDVYVVEIEFQPLMPNNFNTYINYLIGGNEADVGQYRDEKPSAFFVSVKKRIDEINENARKTAQINDKTGSDSNIPNQGEAI